MAPKRHYGVFHSRVKKINHTIATQNSALPLWASSLRNEAEERGIHNAPHNHWQPAQAETAELQSLSHEGRVGFHSRKFVPPVYNTTRRRVYVKPEREEQLLYVALYRDKIAEHQANQEAQKSKDAARSRSRPRAPGVLPGVSAEPAAEHSSLLGDLQPDAIGNPETSVSISGHEASATEAPTAASSSATGAAAAAAPCPVRDAALPPLPDRRSRHPSGGETAIDSGSAPLRPAQDHKKATHIASVISRPGGGGGFTGEYLEGKRLGNLFDEWKARQDHDSLDDAIAASAHSSASKPADDGGNARQFGASAPSSSRTPRGAPSGTSDASAQNSTGKQSAAGAKKVKEKTGGYATAGSHDKKKGKDATAAVAAELDGNEDEEDDGSDASENQGAENKESKNISRLFQVATNPKVTGEATGEADNARRVPAYVEGFPTINLMRLYRGPWRLDI